MNCRGHNNRVNIVNNYDITPLAHLRVLGGMVVHSDAGGDITDSYFLFRCIHKETKQEKIICCGEPTAKDFSLLLHTDLPRIFNPLIDEGYEGGGNHGGGGKIRWNRTRKQLYNAVMLFIMWLGNKPHRVLFSIKTELERDTQSAPPLSKIKAVNTLYTQYHTTARSIINDLEKENRLKDFRFDLLLKELERCHIEQHFEN